MKKLFKNKLVQAVAVILILAVTVLLVLDIGLRIRGNYRAWSPSYGKEDISPILAKATLDDVDYEVLFRQTGLTRTGVDGLIEKGLRSRIYTIQKNYLDEQDYKLVSFAPFTGYMKRTEGYAETAVLEPGDILYSPSTFFSFVRLGHSAIVVDESGTFVQASGYGSEAILLSKPSFFVRPSFAVYRVKADSELRNSAAQLARDEILGKDYSLLAGIFGDKAPSPLNKTHCSHLVWYAYNSVGIDLDSNGGRIITPDQIAASEHLELVQVFGIDPAKLP